MLLARDAVHVFERSCRIVCARSRQRRLCTLLGALKATTGPPPARDAAVATRRLPKAALRCSAAVCTRPRRAVLFIDLPRTHTIQFVPLPAPEAASPAPAGPVAAAAGVLVRYAINIYMREYVEGSEEG